MCISNVCCRVWQWVVSPCMRTVCFLANRRVFEPLREACHWHLPKVCLTEWPFHIKSQLRLLWCDSGQVSTGEASFKLRPVCFLRDVRALTFSCLLDFIWVSSDWRLSTRVSWLLRIALVVLLLYFSEGLVFLGSACIPPKICSPVASGEESHPLKLGENGLTLRAQGHWHKS